MPLNGHPDLKGGIILPNYSIRYVYHRGGTPVMPPGAPPFPDTLAHHHIISYPRMFAIGALTLCHLRITPGDMRKMSFYITNLANIVNTIRVNDNIFSLDTNNISLINALYTVAWTPGNLFVGPASKLRSDDPSQRQDKNPLSMPPAQKTFVSKLTNASSCITSYVPNVDGMGGTSTTAISISPSGLSQLASHFFTAISSPAIQLNTLVKDWYVEIDRTKYHVYFHQGRERRLPEGTKTFKIAVAQSSDRLSNNRCVKIYGYRDRGQDSKFEGIIVSGMDAYNGQKDKPIENYIRSCPKNG